MCRANSSWCGNRWCALGRHLFVLLCTFEREQCVYRAFFQQIAYPLGGIGFVALTYLVIVGTSNAVNLTDGLDGLAAFPVVLVAGGLAIFAYASGHVEFARYLQLPHVVGANEVVISRAAMRGVFGLFVVQRLSCASVYGRRGRAGAGAALGTVAVIVRQEIVLFIMGGLFVVEAVSVMLQGLYKPRKLHFPFDG